MTKWCIRRTHNEVEADEGTRHIVRWRKRCARTASRLGRVTQGKTDTDSMNTVLLCLAAGKPPKPAITVAEAKAAIKQIRKERAARTSLRNRVAEPSRPEFPARVPGRAPPRAR